MVEGQRWQRCNRHDVASSGDFHSPAFTFRIIFVSVNRHGISEREFCRVFWQFFGLAQLLHLNLFVKQNESEVSTMSQFTSKIKTFIAGESGTTSVEYAVMLGLLIAACFAAITFLGTENGDIWNDNDVEIANALR